MAKRSGTDDLLPRIGEKVRAGLDDTMAFAEKVVKNRKLPTRELITDGVELMFKGTALGLELLRTVVGFWLPPPEKPAARKKKG
jgi:hypothetical protein